MVWTYLAESADCLLPSKGGSNLSPIVKSTPIVKQCFYHAWERVKSPMPQYGTISNRLILMDSETMWTSSMEDSPVRISVLQEMEKAWRGSEASYFSRLFGFPKKSSPNSYSWKTSPPSLLEGVFESLKKLPAWGMIHDGVLYPLKKVAMPFMKEKGGSYWPTPRASDSKRQDSPSDRKRNSPSLTTRVNMELGTKNQKINLKWMEWLMGYPIGWTELKPLETQSCHPKLEKLLKF